MIRNAARFFSETPKLSILKRQDTNGVRYTIDVMRTEQAHKLAETYEARGHHQTYWVEELPGYSPINEDTITSRLNNIK
jgi:hypothetical protein